MLYNPQWDRLTARPISIKDANLLVKEHHRHSRPVHAARFAVSAVYQGRVVGVAIVGNPVARKLVADGTAEVVRCCTVPDAPKGTASFLYSLARRVWQTMGGLKLLTYTLTAESGATMRGAGWKQAAYVAPSRGPDRPSRPRVNREIYALPKIRWETEIA